jgi:hypothetical protein
VRALALAPASVVPAARDKPDDFTAHNELGAFATRDEPGVFAPREELHAAIVSRAVRFVLEYNVAALGERARPCQARGRRPRRRRDTAASGLVRVRRPEDLAEDCVACAPAISRSTSAAFAACRHTHRVTPPPRCFLLIERMTTLATVPMIQTSRAHLHALVASLSAKSLGIVSL